jgi:hypothetical protein
MQQIKSVTALCAIYGKQCRRLNVTYNGNWLLCEHGLLITPNWR